MSRDQDKTKHTALLYSKYLCKQVQSLKYSAFFTQFHDLLDSYIMTGNTNLCLE